MTTNKCHIPEFECLVRDRCASMGYPHACRIPSNDYTDIQKQGSTIKTLAELREMREGVHNLYIKALKAHKIARAAERVYFEHIKEYTKSLPNTKKGESDANPT